ncbi:DNA replication/checkpoint protein [Daldinia caldariorum]|uniref:DNA replication/checkpoint protein n=1 Tax=Daldinia caldariorum TaxID=326644 RepID=UPI002008D743|nr:DNA replication/checkpoint protein [Daldinia caldariorum]KAI1469399.1 DNA replication/checkpoint protein [Daldinia caldariorum]
MDESEKLQYEDTCKQLRADLKHFEADWASRNGGAKPGREDIKNNPEIARKYKKYNQVRDILSGKIPPPKNKSKESSSSRKREPEEASAVTPSKRPRPAETPSHIRERIIDPEMFATPSSRKLFSPAVPTSVGPTPQRDGRILGLFDLLDENDENTPSKNRRSGSLGDSAIHATPSKNATSENVDDAVKLNKTPTSNKRTTLFTTPSRRDRNTPLGRTPSSIRKLQLTTPSFLRRAPLTTVDENGDYIAPAPLRLPRKPLGRSLSSAVASLRKLEEEALDDDLEALREVENDANQPAPSKPAKKSENILEPDSQAQQLLGGFDDEALYDSPTEEQVGRNGQPLKIYKKKGQKRTTRRVNMRPTRSKRPQMPSEEQPGTGDEGDVVPETQAGLTKEGDSPPLELGSDSDFDPTEDEGQEPKEKKLAEKKNKAENKHGKVQKAVRKVNELAHANFKRLKLKNHGAKGPPTGFGGRFRRRR